MQLAMLGLNRTFGGIPTSFQLPRDADAFRRFSQLNPNIMWVQKSNAHRGINVLPVDELQLDSDGTFIQQFVDNPLLIDERLVSVYFSQFIEHEVGNKHFLFTFLLKNP